MLLYNNILDKQITACTCLAAAIIRDPLATILLWNTNTDN